MLDDLKAANGPAELAPRRNVFEGDLKQRFAEAEQFDWATRRRRSGERQGPKAYGVGIGQAYHSAGRSGYDGLVGIARDNLPKDGDVPALSVGFAEVEVDLETGKVEVIDYVGVADCGTVLHPQGLAQQVKGGGVWGTSFALHERQIYDTQNGLPGNVGLLTCKPSGYLDVPPVMAWSATDIADPQNPVGVRGVGGPPMGAASAAVLSAISDALGGHLFNRVPVVPDMIVNHVAGRPQSHGPLDVQTA